DRRGQAPDQGSGRHRDNHADGRRHLCRVIVATTKKAPEDTMRRLLTISAALIGLSCALAAPTLAEDWKPTRPIKLICPFPAGGGTDQIARIVALQLSNRLGQQVYVEKRGGANRRPCAPEGGGGAA